VLENYAAGRWSAGSGPGEPLIDPTLGDELDRVSTESVDLEAALRHARQVGGPALRVLTFKERAAMLDAAVSRLTTQRARYGEIAMRNSGNTERDASFDIDGAISTLRYFAKLGGSLEDGPSVRDGEPFAVGRDLSFEAVHLAWPRMGAAIHINAFNFPAWGLWEKAAVSLLAGVPVVTKPASATAMLSWAMVRDVIDAAIFPPGSLSILCGGIGDLLDHVQPQDIIAFTGSAATAAKVRGHPRVIEQSVRVNCEADSLNSIILGPDVRVGSPEFEIFKNEVVREMTLKAGQKCTAIRRILVHSSGADETAAALSAALAAVVVGDPREPDVGIGPVATRAQQKTVTDAVSVLRAEANVVFETNSADIKAGHPQRGAFVMPLLLRANDSATARAAHEVEAFGPVATLLEYRRVEEAWSLVGRSRGSLVTSVVTADQQFACDTAVAIASANGRVLLLEDSVRKANPGHGVVVPSCIHGGPGRAGGGEELGGLRALGFYLQRTAIQGPSAIVRRLTQGTCSLNLL
jgi:3,4-dehydroadipyl-CoA semialdehyde dehydrogenase